MFGLGFGEILLLSAIGLIVLGPKQMPQVARVLGRTIAELRKALHDVTASVSIKLDDEVKKPFQVKELPPHPPNSGHIFDQLNNMAGALGELAGDGTQKAASPDKQQATEGEGATNPSTTADPTTATDPKKDPS